MLARIFLFTFVGLLLVPGISFAEDKSTTLFAKEKWYKNAPGEEKTFSGKLERIPNAGGPSFLQRTRWYKLGDWQVFTRAKKVPALEALVGKTVQFKGKGVEFNLEGQSLREIWPASVTEIKEKKKD